VIHFSHRRRMPQAEAKVI